MGDSAYPPKLTHSLILLVSEPFKTVQGHKNIFIPDQVLFLLYHQMSLSSNTNIFKILQDMFKKPKAVAVLLYVYLLHNWLCILECDNLSQQVTKFSLQTLKPPT